MYVSRNSSVITQRTKMPNNSVNSSLKVMKLTKKFLGDSLPRAPAPEADATG